MICTLRCVFRISALCVVTPILGRLNVLNFPHANAKTHQAHAARIEMAFEPRVSGDRIAITVVGERLQAPGHPITGVEQFPSVLLTASDTRSIAELLQTDPVRHALVF